MLLLEFTHPAVLEAIARIINGQNAVLQTSVREFSGSEYVIEVQPPAEADGVEAEGDGAAKNGRVLLSLRHSTSRDALDKFRNLEAVIRAMYAEFVPCLSIEQPEESSHLVRLSVSLGHKSTDAALVRASQLHLLCLCAPFFAEFDKFLVNPGSVVPLRLPYHDAESIYVTPLKANFIVAMSIRVSDPSDRLFMRTFLQGFVDVRKHERTVGASIGFDCSHGRPPPDVPEAIIAEPLASDEYFWLTISLSKKHMDEKDRRRETTVFLIVQLRNYILYHIKCCKAALHTRMRARVESSLRVLNRAKTNTTGKPRVEIK